MYQYIEKVGTLLHEAGYNTDWIEKCLAHEERGGGLQQSRVPGAAHG